jgi:hypothetical protein
MLKVCTKYEFRKEIFLKLFLNFIFVRIGPLVTVYWLGGPSVSGPLMGLDLCGS